MGIDNSGAGDDAEPIENSAERTEAESGSVRQTDGPEPYTPLALPRPAHPVFFDEDRRRWPWLKRGILTGLFLIVLGAVILAVSVFALAFMPLSALPRVAPPPDKGGKDPQLNVRETRILDMRQAADLVKIKRFQNTVAQKARDRKRDADLFLAHPSGPTAPTQPIVAGFYVNWEQTSNASLHRNVKAITHLIPEWLDLKPAGSNYRDASPDDRPFVDARTKQDREDVTTLARANNVPILPLINNYTRRPGAEEGAATWDTEAVHQIVSDPAARANLIAHLLLWLTQERMQGINVDFEQVSEKDRDNLVTFMRELYASLHPAGLIVTEDVSLDDNNYDIPNLARYTDWIVPMFYDEHAGGTVPGPVAAIDWVDADLKQLLLTGVPAGKIVVGVGNHGYDWVDDGKSTSADDTTYQSAVLIAKESQPDARIHLDPRSLNPTFSYADTVTDPSGRQHDVEHVVWMQDAVSVYNQLTQARRSGVRGSALWFMGSEDPTLWTFYNKASWDTDWAKIVEAGSLDTIAYGGQGEVDFEGDGELLLPEAAPSEGRRTVTRDPKTGLITAESYATNPTTGEPELPSSWTVRRYGGGQDGNPGKQICLTFDDGPDPHWTPLILDVLKKYSVPATFFVVGKQAEENPQIIRREWDEGHEIGDHTWSHPDMFKLTPEYQLLQLNATQRVIQAITGHTTTLFRPPYGGDTEPQTGKEVAPMQFAANEHYITVGERNDPQDWRLFDLKPDALTQDPTRSRDFEDIVKSVVVNRDVGSVVLLHDAGGDRSRTVAALPEIITQLRALGYSFISVADLRYPALAGHMSEASLREKLMPPVSGKDIYLVGADKYVFEVTYLFQRTLTTLFTLSIVLGVSRVLIFVGLALIQRARERRRVFPVGFTPSVSVVIAAYNEEKVIARTVRSLLDSGYPDLEILVVDDGSADNTAEVVETTFASDARVRLFRKENGGKASALNRGIQSARGEIIVSLDADTLFAPDTVSRLVRHFLDPEVGAVSGNVRVGNTHNIWTRWQALEYITSQNFDRRGYDLLNCITVVPGAVGALRRSAVVSVGGYTPDTLAEDTDLTWKLRTSGWRIVNDNSAMAYTEAPDNLRNLAKQRFRWAFGTLQCLWKHQDALGQHGTFGWIALPSLWVYQILFPAVSPFMDVAMIWSIAAHNFQQFAVYYLWMFVLETLAAAIAIYMDKASWKLLPWLFLQRFVYRQLMYYVVLKSLVAAMRGHAVGWGKFERKGTARIEQPAP